MRDGTEAKPYYDGDRVQISTSNHAYKMLSLIVPDDGLPFEQDDITVWLECKCCNNKISMTFDEWRLLGSEISE